MAQHKRVKRDPLPEGIHSLLDTDLYKLTMQAALLQHFPDIEAAYIFINRKKSMRLTHEAFKWLQKQINGIRQDGMYLMKHLKTSR
jgi:nicotinate phosphoribosyltransferase